MSEEEIPEKNKKFFSGSIKENNNNSPIHKKIGELLLKAEIIQNDDLPKGLSDADKFDLRLGEMLVMLRLMTTEDLTNVLKAQEFLAKGKIEEELAIKALKQSSLDKLDFEDAIERVLELEQNSLESKKAKIENLLISITKTEQELGSSHRTLANICLELGELYKSLSEFDEAEKQFKRSLNISENSFGKSHLKVFHALSPLIDILIFQEKAAEAEALAWKQVQMAQDLVGSDHLETAAAFYRLAQTLEARARYSEAEQFYLSALRIREKQLGDEHPDMIIQLRQMSRFWSKQGKKQTKKRIGDILKEAGLLTQEELQEAASESQKLGIPLGQFLLSSDSIDPSIVQAGLQAQLMMGDGIVPYELAIKALRLASKKSITFEEALEYIDWRVKSLSSNEFKDLLGDSEQVITAERTLGANHCGVALVCMRLADSYLSQKRFNEAEQNYKRALSILEKFFGPKDKEVADCIFKLAELFYKQNKFSEAEAYLWRTVEIQQQHLGNEHPELLTTLELLADLKIKQINTAQALIFYKTCLAGKEKLYGTESPKLIPLLEKLIAALNNLDMEAESLPLSIKLATIKQQKSAPLE